MFERRFISIHFGNDKYSLFDRGSCYNCKYYETWKGEGYCNRWKKNVSGSESCQEWG